MRAHLIAALLTASLAACGGSSDPAELHTSGLDQLSAGDFAGAVASFEQALAAGPADDLAVTIERDLASAKVHTDPTAAAEDFLHIADAHADAVDADDFRNFGRELKDAGEMDAAINVIDAGIKRFGADEAPGLQTLMAEIVQAAQASGSADLEKLKSLGYVGD